MSDLRLASKPAIADLEADFGDLSISEAPYRAIISIATPQHGKDALSRAISNSFKTEIPAVGMSATAPGVKARFLGTQHNQLFLLFDPDGQNALDHIEEKLDGTAYLTDQSDSWVMISVSGPRARATLQRMSLVDLCASVFYEGAVARTVINHLSTIIICEELDKFLLMSPRSSALSFVDFLRTSAKNSF